MTADEYLAAVESQAEWHDAQARRARRVHFSLGAFLALASATLPVLSASSLRDSAPLAAPLLGAAMSFATALLGLGQYLERWTGYRRTAEALRSEVRVYRTRSGPYAAGDAALPEFVSRVESSLGSGVEVFVQRASRLSGKKE